MERPFDNVRVIPEVGYILEVKPSNMGFGFSNKAGGTGMSNWEYNERYEGPNPIVRIIKSWHDYETGWRTWAVPLNNEAIEYLKKVAHPDKQHMYVSEFDLTLPAPEVFKKYYDPDQE